MNRFLTIAAKSISVVLHPLFVPTYGVVLFCYAYALQEPESTMDWAYGLIGGTAFLTALLPMTVMVIQLLKGSISDLQISNKEERKVSYEISMGGYLLWGFLLCRMHSVPYFLAVIATGATVALLTVLIVNKWWKISAHLTGFGGLTGGLLSYCLYIGTMPSGGTVCAMACITLLLMYARLYLHAHTPTQVCAGWLLGLMSTTLPLFIMYYALRQTSI